jgi:peptidoglycan/LPS O-acetylase OafA/YrhL
LRGVVAPEPGRRYGRVTVIRGGTLLRSARLAIVEALRGLASISVACYHFSGPLDSGIAHGIGSYGWLGVDVFFVISGFVIPLSLYGTDYRIRQFPAFLLRRLVRLEPPYLASIALTILLWHLSTLPPGLLGSPPPYTMAQVGFHLFYLIPLTSYEWLSPPYWSLAYELVFYIAVGLAFSIFIARRAELTAVLIAVVAAVVSGLQGRFGLDGLLTARVLEFGVGILLLRLIVDDQSRFVANATLLALSIVATGCLGGWALGVTVGLAAVAIFAFREARLGRWAYVVGGCSYSLYLTHTSIGGRVVNLTKGWTGGGEAGAVVTILLALAVSFSFAMLFAWGVETPSRRLARCLTQPL